MALLELIPALTPLTIGITVACAFSFLFYYWISHPLRRYRGPVLAKFTDALCGWHAFRKDSHLHTYKNLQKYGSGYREAPNRLIFNTIEAVQDIYFNPNVTKGRAYRQAHFMYKPNLFDATDPHAHKQKRKIVSQVLSESSLRNLQPIISDQINIFLSNILHSRDPVNLTPATRHLAVDIIGFLSFGYELSTQTSPKNRFIIDNISIEVYLMYLYYKFPFMRYLSPLLRTIAWKRAKTMADALKDMIEARMRLPKDARPDFFSHVPDYSSRDGQKIVDTDLWTDAVQFIGSGGTTVSTGMSATFFYLSRHPEVYAKVAKEVRETFSSGQDIRAGTQLASCKYLRAVIDESMRMSPPSILSLYREPLQSSTEPFIVEGRVIPRGTEVAVNPYSLLRNEKYFPDPAAFKPERWLDTTTEEFRNMRKANVIFGFSNRNCAGKQFAYLEMSMVIARTLWYFDFERTDNGEEFPLNDVLVVEHDGPVLKFTPRGDYYNDLVCR